MIIRYRAWNPFVEMEALRRQLDTLFDEQTSNKTAAPMTWTPAIELKDAGDTFIVRALLPGLQPEDVDIQVARNSVSLSGTVNRAEDENQRTISSEFRYGSFRRVVNLPLEVQNDKVMADLKNGVLTLTLPKLVTERVVKLNLSESASVAPEALPQEQSDAAQAEQPEPLSNDDSVTASVW